MKAALDERYGRNKIGAFLSIFPYGGKAQISWISTAKTESICGMLKGLHDHLAADKSGIVKPTDGEVGYFG